MIQAKLQRDESPEDEWTKMNEEIEEPRTLAWKVQPLSKRKIRLRLEVAKNGAEPGRSRTRNESTAAHT